MFIKLTLLNIGHVLGNYDLLLAGDKKVLNQTCYFYFIDILCFSMLGLL